MKKILFILGTKPEALKLLPVFDNCKSFKVCITNQHPNIDKLLNINKNKIIQLKLERNEKGLSGLTGQILRLLDENKKVRRWKPDLIVVHGDTTSALCGALYAFYENIKLCHVESGLRTHNKRAPFPEESNRKIIDYLSDVHFCPTENNKNNLNNENICNNIHVVGNTIIDFIKNIKTKENKKIKKWLNNSEYGLVTIHRRENWNIIQDYLKIISKFATEKKQKIIYVCNNNKKLKKIVKDKIKSKYVFLSNPLEPKKFYGILSGCSFVLTDSGGIQEEASFLGKPMIILRNETERDEIIKNKCGVLANKENLRNILNQIKNKKFNQVNNLYGNGNTAFQITKLLLNDNRKI